jgi:hypothetical protein
LGSFMVIDAAVTGVLAAVDTPHLRLKSDVNFNRCVLEKVCHFLLFILVDFFSYSLT